MPNSSTIRTTPNMKSLSFLLPIVLSFTGMLKKKKKQLLLLTPHSPTSIFPTQWYAEIYGCLNELLWNSLIGCLPSIVGFQYYCSKLNAQLHIEIQWMPRVTNPLISLIFWSCSSMTAVHFFSEICNAVVMCSIHISTPLNSNIIALCACLSTAYWHMVAMFHINPLSQPHIAMC